MYKYTLIFLFSLNFLGLSGQTINFHYNASGNRESRYIVLQTAKNSLNEFTEDSKGNNFTEDSKANEFEAVLEEVTIKIYPNPTDGELNVRISGMTQHEAVSYQLFSQSGILIQTNKDIGSQFSVDLSSHAGGLYILKLMINEKASVWKILKQ
jgi:hypothetical protein